MSSAAESRDSALIEKAAKFYFEYKQAAGPLSLDDFLKLLEGVSEEIREDIRAQIRNGLLLMALDEALKAAEKALGEKAAYRKFEVEFGKSVEGALHIPLTVIVYPSGLYAYTTTKNTALPPSYRVFGALIRELYGLGMSYKEYGPFGTEEKVKSKAEELLKYFELFPEGEIREPQRYDPEWLQRALEAYYIYKGAEFGYRRRAEDLARRYKILLWKLYEAFTLFLLLRVLMKKGFRFRFEKEGVLSVFDHGSIFRIFINKPLEGFEVIQSVDKADGKLIESLKGRPDISINEKRIALECKYSTSMSYLTAGRFKVLAYIYEFDLAAGILVSPQPELDRADDEEKSEEVNGTKALYKLASDSRGLLELSIKGGKKMFVMILDPLEDDKELEERMEKFVDSL